VSADTTQERTAEFDVVTRSIEPTMTDPTGADIEMLETLLWQLGLSSQYGFPGSSGDRIDNIAPDGSTVLLKSRNEYTTGYGNVAVNSSLPRSQKAAASLEKMIRRFQGRNEATSDIGSGTYAGDNAEWYC